jgi:hypothetical protein
VAMMFIHVITSLSMDATSPEHPLGCTQVLKQFNAESRIIMPANRFLFSLFCLFKLEFATRTVIDDTRDVGFIRNRTWAIKFHPMMQLFPFDQRLWVVEPSHETRRLLTELGVVEGI